MSSLVVILIFMLQFEACISGRYSFLTYSPGHDAILPCDNAPPYDSTCSIVNWFYSRDSPWTIEVVQNGNIIKNSARAARLSLYSNCSLRISNIAAEDAGAYYCRPGENNALLTTVYLNILTTGIGRRYIYLYYRPGHDAILPCDNAPPFDSTCSIVQWFYNRDRTRTVDVVWNGKISKSSARAARLSLYSNCALGINNIAAEDAGTYCCRPGGNTDQDTVVFLHILNISASPSDTDPKRDGDIRLECSLFRYSDLCCCDENSIRWMDDTGTVLLDRSVMNTGRACVSLLTVNHQSGHNKTYTCQFVEKNSVKIEAHYTPVFTELTDRFPPSYILWAVRITGVILIIVITVLAIRHRGSKKPLEDTEVHNVGERDGGTVNYENVVNI